jgi:hypothetical protein
MSLRSAKSGPPAAVLELPDMPCAKRPGRPAKVGSFRRLDLEIEESEFVNLDEMKRYLGVRTYVEVVRKAVRVLLVLLRYRAAGKSICIVDPADPDKRMEIVI